MRDIIFIWSGKSYVVKPDAFNRRYIVLPNRKVIKPVAWACGTPLMLDSAVEVAHHLEHASVGEIAEHMGNAILAREHD